MDAQPRPATEVKTEGSFIHVIRVYNMYNAHHKDKTLHIYPVVPLFVTTFNRGHPI